MNIQQITSVFQDYCHQGHSLNEVEILDTSGNVICRLGDVHLKTDHDRRIVQITVHHKSDKETNNE